MAKEIPPILYIGLNCDSTVPQLRCRIHFPPLHWAVLVIWMNNVCMYVFIDSVGEGEGGMFRETALKQVYYQG